MKYLVLVSSLFFATLCAAQSSTERRIVAVTPTIDTEIYASGDQIGTATLVPATIANSNVLQIDTITVMDLSKQKAAINVLFFSSLPTVVSVDNGAFDISDAEMAAKCLGYVPIASADYKDIANSSVATVRGIDLSVLRSTALYMMVLSAGTPTYTSTADLVFKIGVRVG